MIGVENFIGNPNDKTLYKGCPDTVVTDLGSRSRNNFKKTLEKITNVF
jgi:hypothetical protein